MEKATAYVVALSFAFLSVMLWHSTWSQDTWDPITDGVPVPKSLLQHSKEFIQPEIIKVTEGVHVAIGFALANSILLEGPDGLVIVDTTESEEAAAEILRHFRNISKNPIKAIVYTHNHADHCRGARPFIEDPENPPLIIAHELFIEEVLKLVTTGERVYRGSAHQFGLPLSDDALVNAGIGPRLRIQFGHTIYAVLPNVLIKGENEEMDIAGLHLEFHHIPGETPDQLGIWMPDKKVFLSADNIYKTFPNLYAIRGTPPRDVQVWANSLHKLATFRAEHLVPSHTRPISGEKVIYDLLTTYGNAIQFIHDQTVRNINKQIHPNEIAKLIKLPKRLATHPYLEEFYGTIAWSVKSIYTQYLGWFSGDPVELFPLTPSEKSKKMVELVGRGQLLQSARDALAKNDEQWALELVNYVRTASPASVEARRLKLEVLRALASKQTSANARHYYLTAALEDNGRLEWSMDVTQNVMLSTVFRLLQTLKTRLKAEEVEGVIMKVAINCTDTNEAFILTLEDSVLQVNTVDEIPEVDITITTTTLTWKELMLQKVRPLAAYMSGTLSVEGSLWQLRKFIGYFERTKLT